MNITFNLPEDLIRAARIRALELDTSLNAEVERMIRGFVGLDDDARRKRVSRALKLADKLAVSVGHTFDRNEAWGREGLR